MSPYTRTASTYEVEAIEKIAEPLPGWPGHDVRVTFRSVTPTALSTTVIRVTQRKAAHLRIGQLVSITQVITL